MGLSENSLNLFSIFYVYWCLACTYVWFPQRPQKCCWIPWNWNYRAYRCWELNEGLLQEQRVLFTTELFLQPLQINVKEKNRSGVKAMAHGDRSRCWKEEQNKMNIDPQGWSTLDQQWPTVLWAGSWPWQESSVFCYCLPSGLSHWLHKLGSSENIISSKSSWSVLS